MSEPSRRVYGSDHDDPHPYARPGHPCLGAQDLGAVFDLGRATTAARGARHEPTHSARRAGSHLAPSSPPITVHGSPLAAGGGRPVVVNQAGFRTPSAATAIDGGGGRNK
ncbi:hypothetical protein ACTWQF_34430 [Streptomyces sp. 8N114]|uniref:hypothetical protein n=1 Tax=Streptomyces sp. 8N114 TaxID=3457419 RepID=UPI003FD62057